jgi:hypothetical protein
VKEVQCIHVITKIYTTASEQYKYPIRTVQISNQNKFCHFYNERFCIFVLGVSILPLFLWFRYLYCSDWIFVLFWLDICTVLIGYLYCSDWISVLFWLDICTVLIGYLYCSDWIFVLFWCCGIYFCYHMYTLYFHTLTVSLKSKYQCSRALCHT